MSDRQPIPPEALSEDEVEYLKQFSTEQLRDVVCYTQALVEHSEQKKEGDDDERKKEEHDNDEITESARRSRHQSASDKSTGTDTRTQSRAQLATDSDNDEPGPSEQSTATSNGSTADELPDDVPAKATTTIKEINGNRYYYWQWRDGEKIRSKYKGPVNPDN